jgi:hypothetical protein
MMKSLALYEMLLPETAIFDQSVMRIKSRPPAGAGLEVLI